MTTHFITAEIDLQATSASGACSCPEGRGMLQTLPSQLHHEIEAELQRRGEPLRWAVTSVDTERQTAQVEAIVTVESQKSAVSL
ncbi:MAG: hypothetical protein EBE86_027505 [Hormoscilla sp. GUM202]|nr:hypothetical protein [Hormoscilla sp. GUM202]